MNIIKHKKLVIIFKKLFDKTDKEQLFKQTKISKTTLLYENLNF